MDIEEIRKRVAEALERGKQQTLEAHIVRDKFKQQIYTNVRLMEELPYYDNIKVVETETGFEIHYDFNPRVYDIYHA